MCLSNFKKNRFEKNYIALIVIVILLSGCSGAEEKTAMLGPYRIGMISDPSPPKVGFDASFQVSLADEKNVPLSECQPSFRHYMPGMEMSHDDTFIVLQKGRNAGEYQGRSRSFSMGGNWVVEFVLKCPQESYSHSFNYALEWPE